MYLTITFILYDQAQDIINGGLGHIPSKLNETLNIGGEILEKAFTKLVTNYQEAQQTLLENNTSLPASLISLIQKYAAPVNTKKISSELAAT